MPKIRVDGVDLWYQLRGQGEIPLVMIGGFALVDKQFEFCDPHLVPHRRILHWHYRGVGKSGWSQSGPYSTERWVDDLKAILDHEGIKKISLWCTSTGSSIGLRFAAKYPELMHALVAYPFVRADQTWKEIYRVSAGVGRVFGIETLSRLFAGVVLPPKLLYSKEGISYERWAKGCYRNNVNLATIDAVLEAYSNVDLTGDLPNIRCPTLLLMGDESALNSDEKLNSASYKTLMDGFLVLKPDVELATIKGAGSTYCMITRPKDCCAAVNKFLNALDRPTRSTRKPVAATRSSR